MCGRYASARSVDDIADAFGISTVDVPPAADWNIAPTNDVPVVVDRGAERVLTAMRWGLVPRWAGDPSVGSRMFNARMETAAEKPAFREALARRRCLLPADGWYEWEVRPDRSRQPYYLSRPDGGILAFAGLWETWHDGSGRTLTTVTILTGPAPEDIRFLHERAPVVLDASGWDGWLREGSDAAATLCPTSARTVVAWPVGTAVGDARATGPGLVAQVPVDVQPPLF